jgi:YqaJ-like viral recombinase domain
MEAKETKSKRLCQPLVLDSNAIKQCFSECISDNLGSSAAVVQLSQPKRLPCDLFGLAIEFAATDLIKTSENFLKFASENISEADCKQVQQDTIGQSSNASWHRLRVGRVTASKFHETANCSTSDDVLVESIMGALKFKPTEYVKRGLRLEDAVRKKMQQTFPDLVDSGVFVSSKYPQYAASPDGISRDFVLEIKCPAKKETVKNYLSNGKPTAKCRAQLMLQMLLTGRRKGLFCVADVGFEQNQELTVVEVDFDEVYCSSLINRCDKF